MSINSTPKLSNFVFVFLLVSILGACFTSCNRSGKVEVKDTSGMHQASAAEVEKVVESFILAEEGSTINIPAGFYEFETQLILDNIKDVTIKGSGMEQTILSFKKLKTGGEGMKIVGENVVLEDFSIYDAPGDGVKTQHCDGITFRKINATWTNGDKSKNGTYAIYPVQCTDVLIDQCMASHSRDAGIYVGQSDNIVVKNCTAFGNVAGIEIENCTNAEVYDNKVYDNSGGVLVFNLPNLPKGDGSTTRVYRNEIIDNNHTNFARPINETPNGNTVTLIPPGSGVILLAAKDVEIFDNKILRNKTVGVAIANYQITGFPSEAPNWSPYSSDISIHDNSFERPTALPDVSKELGQLITAKNAHGIGKSQDIIYDGFWDKTKSPSIAENPMNICINEEEIADLYFTRFYLMEGLDKLEAHKDYAPFVCEHSVETNVKYLSSN